MKRRIKKVLNHFSSELEKYPENDYNKGRKRMLKTIEFYIFSGFPLPDENNNSI